MNKPDMLNMDLKRAVMLKLINMYIQGTQEFPDSCPFWTFCYFAFRCSLIILHSVSKNDNVRRIFWVFLGFWVSYLSLIVRLSFLWIETTSPFPPEPDQSVKVSSLNCCASSPCLMTTDWIFVLILSVCWINIVCLPWIWNLLNKSFKLSVWQKSLWP